MSIKNHANINKSSLGLTPTKDGRFRIQFRVDCRMETEVRITLATKECLGDDGAVEFRPQADEYAEAVLPPKTLPAESDCMYTSASINVRNFLKVLHRRPSLGGRPPRSTRGSPGRLPPPHRPSGATPMPPPPPPPDPPPVTIPGVGLALPTDAVPSQPSLSPKRAQCLEMQCTAHGYPPPELQLLSSD